MMQEFLALRHVSLSENGNKELTEVSFSLYEGDILGLISLDNQGLSSLLDLIQNNRCLDHGHMFFCGQEVSNYLTANKANNKAALVESQSHLIPALTIADNFFSVKKGGSWLIHRKKQNQQIRMIFEPYGISLNGTEYPDSLDPFERCRVEIIKAKTLGCKVIILREPSSFLTPKETSSIQQFIRTIAHADGVSFIYVYNHHQEIMSVCTRMLIMYSGTIILNKTVKTITEETMSVVSSDFLQSLTKLHKQSAQVFLQNQTIISSPHSFELSVAQGECIVLLDMDNTVIPEITKALFAPHKSACHIVINGKEAYLQPATWSFIPENPIEKTLFFNLSYIDNLLLRKATCRIPHFWLHKRYRKHIIQEFARQTGGNVKSRNLLSLTQKELYELVYRRIHLENPDVLFIIQPFTRMDMYQRIRVLEYITDLQNKGMCIIILAISLADSLQVASRLIIMQNGHIEKEFTPNTYYQAAHYGLITR